MKLLKPIIPFLAFTVSFSTLTRAADVTRAPYLQLTTDTSQTIVWRTDGEVKPEIRIGKSMKQIASAKNEILVKTTADLFQGEKKLQAKKGTIQYEAKLSELEPNTTYYYAIYHDGERVTPEDETYYFKTHPVPGAKSSSRFWIVGDSGTGGSNQKLVHEGLKKWLGEKKLDGYLHVGDMAYGSGTDPEFSKKFFPIYETTLRNTTCWASLGNHEGRTSKGKTGIGPFYDAYVLPTNAEAGGVPSGSESYYSFDYGNVHFICLNSHDLDRRPTAAMAQWLKADLEKTKAEWLIAFYHHPPYTKGSHDSDKEHQLIEMREHIMPILESGGVDAVFTGHSHIYERSMLIDGAYETPSTSEGVVLDDGDGDPREGGDGSYKKSAGLAANNGTIQVVAGNGGAPLRRKGNHVLMSKVILMFGSVILETKDNELSLTMIDREGKEQDYCVIKKAGKVERTIVKNPRSPELIEDPNVFVAKPKSLPSKHEAIIQKHSEWDYLAGVDLHPKKNWTKIDYVASSNEGWKKGQAGFGYNDNDDKTLIDMRNKFTTVYIRKEFTMDDPSLYKNVGLAIKYDDAFIAYLNGSQILRRNVDFGNGATAKGVTASEAKNYDYFALAKQKGLLRKGKNVLTIEGHNVDIGSSDLTLDPYLIGVRKESKK